MAHAPTTSHLDDVSLRRQLRAALGDAYLLDRELDRGGMGRLFLATERGPGRRVVIKVLPRELADAETEARFRREVAVTDGLRHPHVLPVLAAGETAALLFYVTPHVAGGSLRERLVREGRLPAADVVRLLGEVAGALAHAHAHGVVHGDVKPENVLLDGGHVLLADFGAARLRSRGRDGAPRPPVVGTPLYMSPEQAIGEAAVDARSDVYSLAVVGYELLTGRPPFTGSSPRAVLLAHLGQPVPPLRARRPDVPPALAAVIERALAKAPSSRHPGAAAFRLALAASLRPARPAVRRTPAATSGRRPAWQALAAGVLLPLVTTLGAAALSATLLGGTLGAAGGATRTALAQPSAWTPAADSGAVAPRTTAAPTLARAHARQQVRTPQRSPAYRLAAVVVRPGSASGAAVTAGAEGARYGAAMLGSSLEVALAAALESRGPFEVVEAVQAVESFPAADRVANAIAAIVADVDLRALAQVRAPVHAVCPQQRTPAKRSA